MRIKCLSIWSMSFWVF